MRARLLRIVPPITLFVLAMTFVGCDLGNSVHVPPEIQESSTEGIEDRILKELEDRSFRQFEPSVDASPRKGVVLNFSGRVGVWAQYSVANRAINEWEIVATDHRIEWNDSFSEVTVHFDEPQFLQILPTECDDCIQVTGFSLSIRDLFNSEKISFKLNAPGDVLPPPFPIFTSWTRFREDEYFE